MRSWFLIFSLLLGFGVYALSSKSQPPARNLVGQWSLQVPGQQCVDYTEFFEDGTRHYRSDEEVGTARYELSTRADGKHYDFADTITSSNGKPGCGSPTSPVGDRVEAVVHFSPSGQQFYVCFGRDESHCIGPYQRLAPPQTPRIGANLEH